MTTITKKFPKREMQDLVYEGETDNLILIEKEIMDTGRWSIYSTMVFKDRTTEDYYRANYSEGATEQQDESPFEYDGDEIECVRVVPVSKTAVVFEEATNE